MKPPSCLRAAIGALPVFLTLAAFGQFASVPVQFDQLVNSATVVDPFKAGDNLMLSSLVTNSTGALNQTINFTVGAGVTSVSGGANWDISTAAGFGPRLTGVNIDVFNSATNGLVVSDAFAGTLAGSAFSTFASALGPGSYTMVITGTGVRDSSLDLFLNFGGTAATPSSPIVSGSLSSFEKIATPLFLAEDTLYLNSIVTGQTGALLKSIEFTLGAGVTGFSGMADWAVSSAAGTDPRLTGVNIDLLDSTNTVLFSDTFAGLLAGRATSVFADAALTSGTYTLVASGTAVRDVDLNVALTFTGTRPPISALGQFASVPVQFDQLVNSATVVDPFKAGDNLMLSSLVTNSTGALNQTINFTVGAGVTSVSGGANWDISTAAGFGPRLTGVNIDVFNSATNGLVVSDAFAGTLAGSAFSTFASALGPGSYKMVITGTGVRDSSLDLFLNFGGTAATPSSPIVSGSLSSFEKIATPLFLAEDTLYLNSIVTGQTGALLKSIEFTLGAGVTGFSGMADWAVSSAAGTDPRLTGVNIDLLDSTNTVLFSDTFAGLLAGRATSVFADAALTSGNYKLVASGTAVRDVDLNVALTFTGTRAPEFSSVPEPGVTGCVAAAGLIGLLASRIIRRRKIE